MTKEEFLPMLSRKAQNIVTQNIQIYNNLTFEVFYSNASKVISNNAPSYIIYVKNNIQEDTEYRFLHEFFHCVQYEEGFPTIISQSEEYKDLASSLSSIILDLDVRERLENNGYFQDLKYIREFISVETKMLNMIKQYKDKTQLSNLYDYIDISGLLITSDIAKIDNKKLLNLVAMTRPKIIGYYKVFCDCLEKYSYSSCEDVEKIFNILIDKFNLASHIQVVHHTNQSQDIQ